MSKNLLLLLVLLLAACNPGSLSLPKETLTPTLTETPSATQMPTETPPPTETFTPTPVPGGPCDNPLVPLAMGNQWTYQVTTGSGESLYTLKSLERQDGANIIVVVEYQDQIKDFSIQEQVVCQDGAIENYPLFVMSMLFSDYLYGYMKTYHDTGVYSPAYQTFNQNQWIMDWQTGYLTEDIAHLRNPQQGEPDLWVLTDTPIQLSFHMDGTREPVDSPAGYFPLALKITQEFALNVTLSTAGSGSGSANRLTLMTTQWYEPYIGLVRARIDSASLSGGYGVPLESTLELVEFIPGQ